MSWIAKTVKDHTCATGCFPQTGGKQRAHEANGTIRFTSSSEITNSDNVLFQATRVPVYSGMTLLSEKLVTPPVSLIHRGISVQINRATSLLAWKALISSSVYQDMFNFLHNQPKVFIMEHSPLGLASKLNSKAVDERLHSLFNGLNGDFVGPLVVELDPTTACNLACHDCISANLLNQGGIEDNRLMALVGEFKDAGVKAVVLIGGGEPMAHRKFGELVTALSAADIHVGVTTNGTLIRRYTTILSEHVKWLRVSMDSGTAKTFGLFRPGMGGKNHFSDIIDQIRDYAKSKSGLLGYSFLILSKYNDSGDLIASNAGDIYTAAVLARDIGCDYFEVKPSFDMMHYLNRQPPSVVATAKEQLHKATELETSDFKVISPPTLVNALQGNVSQPKAYTTCRVAELRTVITPSGAYVCPYYRGNLNMRIGTLEKMSFREMWASKKRKAVMDRLNPSVHCGFHCIRHSTNETIEGWISGEITLSNTASDRFI